MTKEELTIRIEKAKEKISKIEKRADKWTQGMSPEAKELAARCEILYTDPNFHSIYNEYNSFRELHQRDPEVFRQDYNYNKGPQFDEAYRAYRDLAEAKNTLHKYEVALTKLTNFDKAEKIEAIWSFLQDWKKEMKEYIVEGCELLGQLKAGYEKAFEEHKKTPEYSNRISLLTSRGFNKWRADYEAEGFFKQGYYSEVPSISYKFYTGHGNYNDKALEKFLDESVIRKYKSLVSRITEKSGEILDADGLYIAHNGEINGYVVGQNGTVKVETITAEGPIQTRHYRVLVHLLKK